MQKTIPGYVFTKLKAGYGTGIVEDSCVISYPLYILTHKGADDESIGLLTKAIYENIEKLQKETAMTKTWVAQDLFNDSYTVPFHPASISYFKSKGLWNEKLEARQNTLLK